MRTLSAKTYNMQQVGAEEQSLVGAESMQSLGELLQNW